MPLNTCYTTSYWICYLISTWSALRRDYENGQLSCKGHRRWGLHLRRQSCREFSCADAATRLSFEPEFGPIAEFHFETRESGHSLDDLLLVTQRGTERTRFAISIKSNRQLTKDGFSRDFVQDVWNQWESARSSNFDPAKDLLGLVVGAIDDPTLHEWLERTA